MSSFEEINRLMNEATEIRYSSAVRLKDHSWIMGGYYENKHVWFEPDMETKRFEIHTDDLMQIGSEPTKKFERLLRKVSDAKSD